MNSQRFHLIAAVFILLIKDGKVFLSQRKNTGWKDGEYSLIGGHCDGGETATHAAVREVLEETGVVVKAEDLQFVNICHLVTNSERVHFSFAVEVWEGEPQNNEPEKAESVGWFSLENLPENLTDISRATLEWYKNGITYSEFGWEEKS